MVGRLSISAFGGDRESRIGKSWCGCLELHFAWRQHRWNSSPAQTLTSISICVREPRDPMGRWLLINSMILLARASLAQLLAREISEKKWVASMAPFL